MPSPWSPPSAPFPDKHEGWIKLEDHLRDQLKDFDPKLYALKTGLNRLKSYCLFQFVTLHGDRMPKRLKAFLAKIEALPYRTDFNHTEATLWGRLFDKEVPAPDATLFDQFEQLMAKHYPLMGEIASTYRGDRQDTLLAHYLSLIVRK